MTATVIVVSILFILLCLVLCWKEMERGTLHRARFKIESLEREVIQERYKKESWKTACKLLRNYNAEYWKALDKIALLDEGEFQKDNSFIARLALERATKWDWTYINNPEEKFSG